VLAKHPFQNCTTSKRESEGKDNKELIFELSLSGLRTVTLLL
jgi:hypothetical protein